MPKHTGVVSFSDLRAISFVPSIRERIEELASENLRALLEDDPEKWLKTLSSVLSSVTESISNQLSIGTIDIPPR
jgi:hypothetical protein